MQVQNTTFSPTQHTTNAFAAAQAKKSGLSSTNSSISSASNPGISSQISSCVSSVVSAVRNCLARIPLIGRCFRTTVSASAAQSADIGRLQTIKAVLTKDGKVNKKDVEEAKKAAKKLDKDTVRELARHLADARNQLIFPRMPFANESAKNEWARDLLKTKPESAQMKKVIASGINSYLAAQAV